jgi:antitoxin component of RelBE/YafQ-DinJ toxin-antitoxin module
MKISEPLEVVVKVCLTVATVVSIILPNAAYAQTTLPFSVTLQNLRLQLAAALKNDSKTKDLTLRDEAHCLPFPDDATDQLENMGRAKDKMRYFNSTHSRK